MTFPKLKYMNGMNSFTYLKTVIGWPLECLVSTDDLARNTQQSTHNIKVPSSIYDLMLMTKEFNNEISDSYTI